MSLLESVVLLDVVEVGSPDDDGPLHLLALHDSSQDSSTDAHVPSEGTLLVYVRAFSSLGRKGEGSQQLPISSSLSQQIQMTL